MVYLNVKLPVPTLCYALVHCEQVAWLDDIFCTRRKVRSGGVLPVGGSLPAHLPARESITSTCSTGKTVCTRQQQKWQRRGKKQKKIVFVLNFPFCFSYCVSCLSSLCCL